MVLDSFLLLHRLTTRATLDWCSAEMVSLSGLSTKERAFSHNMVLNLEAVSLLTFVWNVGMLYRQWHCALCLNTTGRGHIHHTLFKLCFLSHIVLQKFEIKGEKGVIVGWQFKPLSTPIQKASKYFLCLFKNKDLSKKVSGEDGIKGMGAPLSWNTESLSRKMQCSNSEVQGHPLYAFLS